MSLVNLVLMVRFLSNVLLVVVKKRCRVVFLSWLMVVCVVLCRKSFFW